MRNRALGVAMIPLLLLSGCGPRAFGPLSFAPVPKVKVVMPAAAPGEPLTRKTMIAVKQKNLDVLLASDPHFLTQTGMSVDQTRKLFNEFVWPRLAHLKFGVIKTSYAGNYVRNQSDVDEGNGFKSTFEAGVRTDRVPYTTDGVLDGLVRTSIALPYKLHYKSFQNPLTYEGITYLAEYEGLKRDGETLRKYGYRTNKTGIAGQDGIDRLTAQMKPSLVKTKLWKNLPDDIRK